MKELLQTLASRASSDMPLGTVFVIGAGRGMALQDIRALSPQELVIAEPRAEAVQALQQRLVPEKERVLPKAIVASDVDSVDLHVPSNPRYSSVREPTTLLRHFPNLLNASVQQVQAVSITWALESLQLASDAHHVLIIAAPGSAAALLAAAPTQLLRAFSWIILNSANEPLYEGDTSLPALNQALAVLGYDNYAEDGDALPPFTTALYRRNANVVALAQAHAELDELRQHLAFRDAEVQSRTTERDAAVREAIELSEKLAYIKAMLTEERASKQALQNSYDHLHQSNASAGEECQLLAAALTKAQEATQTARTDAEAAQACLSSVNRELDDLKQRMASITHDSIEEARQIRALRKQLDAAELTIKDLDACKQKTQARLRETEKTLNQTVINRDTQITAILTDLEIAELQLGSLKSILACKPEVAVKKS